MLIKRVAYSNLFQAKEWTPARYLLAPEEPELDTKTLKEIVNINPRSRRFDSEEYEGDKVKLVGEKSIDKDLGKIVEPTVMNINDLSGRARLLAEEGDVLVSLSERTNFTAVLVRDLEEENIVVSDQFAVLTFNSDNIDPYYLFWALKRDYVLDQCRARARGSFVKRLPIGELEDIKIWWLNKEERREKGELTKEKFGEMTDKEKALHYEKNINDKFNELFGVTEDDLQKKTTERTSYRAFTDRTKWTLKPFLTKGLEELISDRRASIYSIGEVTESIKGGVNLYRQKDGDKDVKMIKPKNLDTLLIGGKKREFDTEQVNKDCTLTVDEGDILMRRKGGITPGAVVSKRKAGLFFHEHLVRIRVDHERIRPEYLAIYLNSSLGYYLMDSHVKPGTMKYITLSDLREVKVPVPKLESQKEIIGAVKKLNIYQD